MISLDNLVDYIGLDNADLLYNIEESITKQLTGSLIK